MSARLIELHPRLFIRGHTRGILSTVMLREIHEKDIGKVLNVAIIADDFLERACQTVGIVYKHVPLRDSRLQEIPTQVTDLINEVAETMEYTGVLVHCDSGYNRSALIAIPACAEVTGVPPGEIIDRIRLQRPRLLHNPRFEHFVRNYGQATAR